MQFSGDQVTLNGITIQCDQSVQCASTQPYVVPAGKQHTFINVTFQGCSITDVNSFGGAVSVLGSLAIQDSHFISNTAPVSGGAIACTTQQASLSISNTEFQGNSAPQSGGALYIQQCTADVSSSSFTSNNAPQGGAIFAQQATVSVATSTFSSNTASTNGGASMFRDSTASVSGSTWINNTATQSGGAVYIDSTVMAISGSNFSSNQAGSASCASCSGGAVFCQGQRVLNIVWSTFRQNSIGIAGQGGAVFMSSCLSNVSQSTLSLNSAGTGGALAVTSQANLVMDNLQFASNAAAQSGGAVYLTASTATCASTVFISNVATANGGALYASLLASFAVTSGVSFTSNTAGQGGGAVYWDGTIEPGTQGSVFSSNQAVYGPNRATQSRQLMWSRLANGLIVNSRQPIFDARTAIQLQLLDNYNQVVASDSTSSLTLQTVATSTLPVNLASLSRAGSSSPTATPSSGSITGTISCKFVSGNCSFGTTSANAFAVEVTPNFALPLKANVMLSSGSILSSPTILVPARGCLPGEFIDSTQCSPCPIGTFSNASQATSCSSCGDGFYADTTGSISCAVCPDGYSCIDRKSKTLCSSQAYRVAATANSGSCTLCPPSSSSDASRSFCRCDIGFYMVTDPTSTRTDKLLCQSCPLGADCRSAGTTIHNVVALRSYWPEKENTNTSFIHCINSGCSGGPTKCEPAYDGNLCTSCKRGYSRDSAYECTICPSSSSTFWQVLGVIAAVCVLCSCIIYFTLSNTQYNIKKEARLQKARQAALEERQQRRNEKLLALSRKRAQQKVAGDDATKTEAKVEFATDSEQPALRSMKTLPTTVQVVPEASDDPEIMQIINEYEAEAAETLKQEEAHQSVYPTFSILIKIFTSFLQFNSLAAAFNFQWPDAVMFIMHLQKEIAEIAANIISVDCAAYQTGSTFSLFYMKKIVIAFLPPIVVLIPLVLILMWGGIMKLLKRPISIESMKITLVTAVVVVLFFVLPTITQQAFGMLSCIKLGVSADDYYIVDNMDEQCWGSQHMFYLGLVCLPMILLYVFGIPLFSFRILWLSRFALHTAEVKQYFFFLYTGYESEYWFWEYTIVARKIVLVAISVFFQTNVQLQSCT
jgi:predicted outer membrane repeat protein